MILVTGGTGFVGKALVRHLLENDDEIRLLIRPSKKTPDIPKGIPIEVAVSNIRDVRNLQVAMSGVDTIFHLASADWRGARGSLLEVDIQGTRAICQAAAQSRVKHIYFLSHLGADRASAFPLLKAKAIAEEFIRRSGIDYTILRSGIIFGKGDHFTTGIARLANAFPGFFLMPGDGKTLLQPLWIEDLVTCLVWALDGIDTRNQTISIGGPEFIPFNQIVQTIFDSMKIKRRFINVPLPYMSILTIFLENVFPGFPITSYWLDYLSSNRTSSIDTITHTFQLLPSRFNRRLEYLQFEKRRFTLPSFLRSTSKS
jgi:NADH dehydrogenase